MEPETWAVEWRRGWLMYCESDGARREAEISVFRGRRGQWVVRGWRLMSALVFPERQQAVECACDLAVAGRVEVRDHRGALLALFDFGDEGSDQPVGPQTFHSFTYWPIRSLT